MSVPNSSADISRGYDAVADRFAELRSDIGLNLVRDWAEGFSPGASVLDLGAGTGLPLTRALVDAGLTVTAVDASPKMVAAFKRNLPGVEVVCEDVLDGSALGRDHDGILVVGLLFLLKEAEQAQFIARVAKSLKPGGRLLVSVPYQVHEWVDVLTGRASRSLGFDAYREIFGRHDLKTVARHTDDGGNHYVEAVRS